MPDLWDSGPALPAPAGPQHGAPAQARETPPQAPQLDPSAATISPEIAGPVAFGLERAYGSAWQQDYGTVAGRTLTGATPAEAFPDAATPERQQARDVLAQILTPGQRGADHQDVAAILRGALADGMTPADRAAVGRAALGAAVERDPEALLARDPEIPREHLAAWRELAMTRTPQAVLDRMGAMNGPIMDRFQTRLESPRDPVPAPTLWRPLDVREAAGGVVNMDYYPIRARLPDDVDPAVVLNHVRTHLDDFVDTSKSSFAPYPNQPGGGDNVGRWASTRPTGSFVTIDIPVNDGTVAVIDSARDHWTFATVQSPGDGLHPVSGNRQFGYTENGDGTVTFYTRGVDRITDSGSQAVNWATRAGGGPGIAFSEADELWQSFQSGVATYVRQVGGQAEVGGRISIQPDWSRLENVLTGRESVRSFLNREAR